MSTPSWCDFGTPIPDYTTYAFNIEKGSKVRIDSVYGIYQGYVILNPRDTANTSSITLVKCHLVDPKGEPLTNNLNVRRFFLGEIHEVAILSQKTVPAPVVTEATIKIVTSAAELPTVIRAINHLDSVVFELFGKGLGRLAEIGWVCFFAKGVLVALDALTLVEEITFEKFWSYVKIILVNKELLKIVYNNRPVVDFLVSKCGITIFNYCDLQAMDLDIRLTYSEDKSEKNKDLWKWKSLSSLMETYIPNQIPELELDLLKSHEKNYNVNDGKFLIRPFPINKTAKLIVVSTKYLILLRNEMLVTAHEDVSKLNEMHKDNVLRQNMYDTMMSLRDPLDISEQTENTVRDVYLQSDINASLDFPASAPDSPES